MTVFNFLKVKILLKFSTVAQQDLSKQRTVFYRLHLNFKTILETEQEVLYQFAQRSVLSEQRS